MMNARAAAVLCIASLAMAMLPGCAYERTLSPGVVMYHHGTFISFYPWTERRRIVFPPMDLQGHEHDYEVCTPGVPSDKYYFNIFLRDSYAQAATLNEVEPMMGSLRVSAVARKSGHDVVIASSETMPEIRRERMRYSGTPYEPNFSGWLGVLEWKSGPCFCLLISVPDEHAEVFNRVRSYMVPYISCYSSN